uniref:TauD/TfdA-like domain-containing protein n=1 Tax=Alexandrium andersonii TaxID=327968 RepID=A0A7S2FYZ2_9DINO|mmetsp:Transcript_37522/g.85297  ORF Transcript_37522/g.85297 Transcript_37522/m.85297 type:complete len:337 (+) Transcript_37522:94-1104(+)
MAAPSLAGRFMAVAKAQALDMLAAGNNDKETLAKRIREDPLHGDVTVAGVNMRLEPLSPSIGTVIHGVDLAALTPELVEFIRSIWLQRKAVFFRGQSHLTRKQHVDLANTFGTVGAHHGERDWVPENDHVTLERSTPNGFPDIISIYSDEKSRHAASHWHSDVMWSTRPPMGSMLLARKVPPVGGDTVFCDMYAMWNALRPETRQKLEGLRAFNQGGPGHAKDGKIPSAEHPCARTHPETGCTGLFVSPGFTKRIVGVPQEESNKLLHECFALAGMPEFCCRFHWEDGSLAFWDNRACLHYATPDSWPYTRSLERVTVLDKDESKKRPYYAGKAKL